MSLLNFTPLTQKRIRIFKRNWIANYSLWVLGFLFIVSLGSEFVCNDRPYVMKYNGKIYFPIMNPPTGMDLGIENTFTVDYRKIDYMGDNWAVFTPVRFNPYESNMALESYPGPPSAVNWFGTDDRGRDIFARLLYGFRISFFYAIGVWIVTYIVGAILGLTMGYFGGWIDFTGQRFIEVLSSLPVFFLLIILISIFEPGILLLVFISAIFGWVSISYYMRAEALKLRKMEFIEASRAMGLTNWKIIMRHLLPNSLTPLITFSPFAIAGNITGLTALDFLGFGLSPPTPSWGELMAQATKYFSTAWWLAFYPSLALFVTLALFNFVGEGVRNAFDPKS